MILVSSSLPLIHINSEPFIMTPAGIILAVAAALVIPVGGQSSTTATTTTTTAGTPRPTPKETDLCLQRKFLTAPFCNEINPELNNNTLQAAGWRCCWDMSMPVEGNPKLSLVNPNSPRGTWVMLEHCTYEMS